jgi:hypothetical protein
MPATLGIYQRVEGETHDPDRDARTGLDAIRWHDAAACFTHQAEAFDVVRRNGATATLYATEAATLHHLPPIKRKPKTVGGVRASPFSRGDPDA